MKFCAPHFVAQCHSSSSQIIEAWGPKQIFPRPKKIFSLRVSPEFEVTPLLGKQ